MTLMDTSAKRVYRQLMSTRKGAPHHIEEMQIKTTRRCHYIPMRMVQIQSADHTKYRQGCGAIGVLTHCWRECKMVQPLQKTIWWFLTKLNNVLPQVSTTVFLLFTWRMGNTFIQKLAWMFRAASFIIAKIGSNQDALQQMAGYIHCGASRTWVVNSALKISKSSSHEETWRTLKCISVSERSQSEDLCTL